MHSKVAASEEFGLSLEQKAKEFYDLEDDEWQNLLETLKGNIHDGKFRFVVLMDKLHSSIEEFDSIHKCKQSI